MDGVILVSTQENLNKFNGNVNVFKLNYAKAEDVKAALDGLLEGTNKVGTDPITNSILFTGSSTDEDRVRSAIKAMDVATKQITLEAKIIAINKDANAPIFQIAHYGIVGDVKVILPKLIERIEQFKKS